MKRAYNNKISDATKIRILACERRKVRLNKYETTTRHAVEICERDAEKQGQIYHNQLLTYLIGPFR